MTSEVETLLLNGLYDQQVELFIEDSLPLQISDPELKTKDAWHALKARL